VVIRWVCSFITSLRQYFHGYISEAISITRDNNIVDRLFFKDRRNDWYDMKLIPIEGLAKSRAAGVRRDDAKCTVVTDSCVSSAIPADKIPMLTVCHHHHRGGGLSIATAMV
jgi:hypothetical protein